MATKSMAYDHPNYTIRREWSSLNVAGAAAVAGPRFMTFQAIRLKSWSARVITAGTTTTGATLTLRNGTTSIAGIPGGFGTNTAGVTTNVLLSNTIASMEDFNVLGGADATMVCINNIEYEVLPSGSNTA